MSRLVFEGPLANEPELGFREEVLAGLSSSPRRLSPKHLYDQRGSDLFDAICRMPGYYLTRTELEIMQASAREMARAIGPGAQIIELGAGSSLKVRALLDHLERPQGLVAVDISGAHLESAVAGLRADYPHIPVSSVVADFTRRFELERGDARRRVVYFPGSTIGNFEPRRSLELLRAMARLVGPGGGILLGTDLVKPQALLEAAYDDAEGLTARFILNVLSRIERELDAAIDPSAFAYRPRWQADHARMEMLVEATGPQQVRIDDRVFPFATGDTIHIEYSHKYTLESVAGLASEAGLAVTGCWTDPEAYFAVQLLTVNALP